MVDIPEERRAQDELAMKVALLQAALDSTTEGLLVIARDGRVTAWNRRFTEMVHCSAGVLASRSRERVLACLLDQLAEPDALRERVRWLDEHPEGESHDLVRFRDGRYVECHCRPQRLDDAVTGRVWSLRDVTEHRRAEAEARESEERYRSLYVNTPVMMHSIDAEGRLVSVSNAWLEALGYTREEVLGRRSVEFLTAESRKYASEVVLPEFFATGVSKDVPYQFIKKSGEVIDVLLSAICERDADGKVLRSLAVLIDVTLRKRAEETKARLYREAQEAIRVRDDFLAIASHELRTPLTPLALRLQVIERKLRQGEDVDAGLVAKALRQIDQLTNLISDLLDVSRIQAGRLLLHREPVSLRAVVEHLIAEHNLTNPKHQVALTAPGEDLVVTADRARLAQVVTNLLDNAAKYSPPDSVIHVRLAREDGTAVLSVADNGIGIPKEQQAMLFERFFRAKNAPISGYGGLGLGLYITRDIVERHGGRIWVESEVGHGSTFSVALPLDRERTPPSR